MDDAMLIELVEKFPCLYDRGNPNFKNTRYKENAWTTVSEIVKTTR